MEHAGEFNPTKSSIRAISFSKERFFFPMVCLQCEEPVCEGVCPAGVIARDKDTLAVVIDRERCMGCKMCLMVCPFGNIGYSSDELAVFKCDLCKGEPACVAICPVEALEYKDIDDATLSRRREIVEQLSRVLKEAKF